MLGKTGLLVVTNPKQIGKILPSVQKQVGKTLYIQLLSALGEPFGSFHTNIFTSWPKYSRTIHGIYSQASTHCEDLDVRVLLSGIKYQNLTKIQTNRIIDLVIFDKFHNKTEIDGFIKTKIANIANEYDVLTLDSENFTDFDVSEDIKICKHSVLGGTFDRLHLAHKLLLSEAVLRAQAKVTVGVTHETMLQNKILWELIQDLDTRVRNVEDFLKDICAELTYDVVPISDPFGPAIVDPTMDLIVVSEETLRGGQKINEIREKENLKKLEIVLIQLIDEPHPDSNEETKISSSTTRIRLLGTLLAPPQEKKIPKKPYVIGLTGGVASGKSGVAKWLSLHGCQVISCDLIAHQVYKAGNPCYFRLIEHFGKSIVAEDGEIDRKVLGGIVFTNPGEMKKLNELVWPAVDEEVVKLIRGSDCGVVVVEAAVLFSAGWDKNCHEVWTTLVPREEAIKRLKTRNNLTEEQAISRIDAQPSNLSYVKNSNVVLCSLWEKEFTKKQVDKAWDLLQGRIL